jgi:predicted transcriptional regulator
MASTATLPIRRQKHGIEVKDLTVSVPREINDRVRALAEAESVTISSIVAEALRQYFDARETAEMLEALA